VGNLQEIMQNADYHRHLAVSKSGLDQIAKSPLHYWARYLDPNRVWPEPTPAMRLGTALHTHVLELDQWDKQIAIAPGDINRRTKEGREQWAAFEADAKRKTVITADDAEVVMAMGRSVWRHPAAAMLLHWQGKAETTHMWTDPTTGAECKCRPDWLTNDGNLIIDLKTTEDASPRAFQRSVANYRYHVQASWYLDGIEAATGYRPDQFIFICVEKKPPYAVAVYAADAEMVQIGAETAARDLARLVECKASNTWPGYSDQIEPLSLPAWMRPRADGSLPNPPEIETY
jgi:exodeoxyribonuclease VIII